MADDVIDVLIAVNATADTSALVRTQTQLDALGARYKALGTESRRSSDSVSADAKKMASDVESATSRFGSAINKVASVARAGFSALGSEEKKAGAAAKDFGRAAVDTGENLLTVTLPAVIGMGRQMKVLGETFQNSGAKMGLLLGPLALLKAAGAGVLGGLGGGVAGITGAISAFSSLESMIPLFFGLAGAVGAFGAALVATTALVGAFVLAFGGVVAVGAGLVLLAQHAGVAKDAFASLQKATNGMLDTWGKQAGPIVSQLLGFVQSLLPPIQDLGSEVIRWFGGAMPAALAMARSVFADLVGVLQTLGGAFARLFSAVAGNSGFSAAISQIFAVVGNAAAGLLDGLTRVATWTASHWPQVAQVLGDTLGPIIGVFGTVLSAVGNLGAGLIEHWSAIKSLISSGGQPLVALFTTLGSVVGPLVSDFGTLFDALSKGATPAQALQRAFGLSSTTAKQLADAFTGAKAGADQLVSGLSAVLPVVASVARWLAVNVLVPGLSWLATHGSVVKGVLIGLGAGFGALKAAQAANSVISSVNAFKAATKEAGLLGAALEKLNIKQTAAAAKAVALGVAQAAMAVKTAVVTAATWLWDAALAANPITLVVLGIALLIAGIVLLVTHWSQVTQAVQRAWTWLTKMIESHKQLAIAIAVLLGPIGLLILAVVEVRNHWQQLTAFLGKVWTDIKQFFQAGVTAVTMTVQKWVTDIVQFFTWLWTHIVEIVTAVWTWLRDTWTKITTDIRLIVEAWVQRHIQQWILLWDRIQFLVFAVQAGLHQLWTDITTDVEKIVGGFVDHVKGFWTDLVNHIAQFAGSLADNFTSGFKRGLHDAAVLANTFIDDLEKVPAIGGAIKNVLGTDPVPVPAMAAGGIVTRPTLAMIGEGAGPEAVIPFDPAHRSRALQLLSTTERALVGPMGLGSWGLGAAAGDLAAMVGTFGGQCLAWVSKMLGGMFAGIPMAADLVGYINDVVPNIGDVFVSVLPPYGHTGFVAGPNTVIDSNWGLDEMIRMHPLSDIPDIVGYINTGKSVGGLAGLVKGVMGSLVNGPLTAAENAAKAMGGFGGAMALGLVDTIGGAVKGMSFDKGGLLQPGLTLAYNGTGAAEAVLPPGGLGGGGTVVNVTVNVNGAVVGTTQQAAVKWFRDEFMHLFNSEFVQSDIPRSGTYLRR